MTTIDTVAETAKDESWYPSLAHHIDAACERIAPTWPLDQFIAVNPYWGWRSSSAPEAAAMLGALSGTSLTMQRSWFRGEHEAGRLTIEAVLAAAREACDPALADVAIDALQETNTETRLVRRMALATDVRDLAGPPRPGQSWAEHVTHEISQHCAAHFDRWQGSWHPDQQTGLFAGWRNQLLASHGVRWQHGAAWAKAQIVELPIEPEAAIGFMLRELTITDESCEGYLTSLLLSINGWSAWCAYNRWQARLIGNDDNEIVGLLTIRLAWDWLLRKDADASSDARKWADWAASWHLIDDLSARTAEEQRIDWLLQSAIERTYQETLIRALTQASDEVPPLPAMQAVFCIDVRSEVFRRALESESSHIHTRGFAGFFGLPISYTPLGSALTRPQLPGLLSPAVNITESTLNDTDDHALVEQRAIALGRRQRWSKFRTSPSSVFSFVESMGLLYGAKLVKDSLANTTPPTKWEQDGLKSGSFDELRPRWKLTNDNSAATGDVAAKVLRAMGLIDGFAPLVLLCGHGSQTANNPHAAGLDCGACGGQPGEVNVMVLADLLNSPSIREHLSALGIVIPPSTWFVAGVHNTTTDEVVLMNLHLMPSGKDSEILNAKKWLAAAGQSARAERAAYLGLGKLVAEPERLKQMILERANDWSEVRPEWGLAGNASFVVAPRSRTRHANLEGRSFLHDYDWKLDTDLSVLTLIMTAPMLVTNWINMQYNASTVDNPRYGSGNKVLHNVVGGRIGVFEGNGGDLRIGLSIQSLHDGSALRHSPLRLSVFIEAPRMSIDTIISAHTVVRDLVLNEWIHLLRIEPSNGDVERWTRDGWVAS